MKPETVADVGKSEYDPLEDMSERYRENPVEVLRSIRDDVNMLVYWDGVADVPGDADGYGNTLVEALKSIRDELDMIVYLGDLTKVRARRQ